MQPSSERPSEDRPGGTQALPPQDELSTRGESPTLTSEPASTTEVYLAPPQQPDELGRLGSFRILRLMGEGGMGRVYEAEDPSLGRRVAIKVMSPRVAASPVAKARFLREARAVASVESDHVVRIYHVAEDRGVPFFVMPMLAGEALNDALRRNRTPSPRDAWRWTREIAAGLVSAHAQGLVHRDIKPSNIWLEGERRRAVLLDFGLAHFEKAESQLTGDGAVLGTLAYMAPEQAKAGKFDDRADLFSLGAVLYEMLAGQRPFRGATEINVMASLLTTTPPAPQTVNPLTPRRLSELCMWMLQKDPADRPSSAREVVRALDAMLQSKTASVKSMTLPEAEPAPAKPTPPPNPSMTPVEAEVVDESEVEVSVEIDDASSGVSSKSEFQSLQAFKPVAAPSSPATARKSRSEVEFVEVPAGEFQMGSAAGDKLALADERPRHRVVIGRPFAMSACPITFRQFAEFVRASGYRTDAEKDGRGGQGFNAEGRRLEQNPKYNWRDAGFEQSDDHPVVNVSWCDATEFCRWLGKQRGERIRLPSEAEWEYACRAGTSTRYFCGDTPASLEGFAKVADVATTQGPFPQWNWSANWNSGYPFTAPVGSFRPNAFGLFDMHGNVWEWCRDWYSPEYYTRLVTDDPTGPPAGMDCVLRGGSWNGRPELARSASRTRAAPTMRTAGAGFRVVKEL